MLSYEDSNFDKQNQKLLCYHYTIGQAQMLSFKKRCKDSGIRLNIQIFSRVFSFCDDKEIVFLPSLNQQILTIK